MANNANLKTNNEKLASILEIVNALPEASGGGVDSSDATATASDVLSSKIFYANNEKKTGTMPNNGSVSTSFDGINTKSVNIPSGYTSGGTVSLTNDIDNEVSTQEDLIDQISTILDGKAASGEGSGSNIGTCTVKINNECVSLGSHIDEMCYTQLINGTIETTYTPLGYNNTQSEIIIENVLCNSYFYVSSSGYSYSYVGIHNGAKKVINEGSGGCAFITTTESGTICIVNIIDDD